MKCRQQSWMRMLIWAFPISLVALHGAGAAMVAVTNASFELEPAGTGWTTGTGGGAGNLSWDLRNTSTSYSPRQTDGLYKAQFGGSWSGNGIGTIYQTPLAQIAPDTVYTLAFDIGNRSIWTAADSSVTVRVFFTLGDSDVDHWANRVGTAYEATLDQVPNGGWLTDRIATLDTTGIADLSRPLNIVFWVERVVLNQETAQGAFDHIRLSYPARYYVDIATGSDSASGSSWDACFATLTKALDVAETSDDVWVSQGTYTPGAARADTFDVPANVSLYGGFTNGMTMLAQRDPEVYPTVLSGQIGDPGAADNVYRILTLQGAGGVVIDGFRIANANNDQADADGYGGGIYAQNSTFTLRNSRVEHCHAGRGGGVYITGAGSALEFQDNHFTANSALMGGGLWLDNIAMTLNACVFDNNLAEGTTASSGGAIGTSGNHLLVLDCVFSNNIAGPTQTGSSSYGGGAVYIGQHGTAEFRNCRFVGNRALNHGMGGAFYKRQIPEDHNLLMAFYDCVFRENQSEGVSTPGGGAVSIRGTRVAVSNGVFIGNQAAHDGGGLSQYLNPYGPDLKMYVQDSFFSNNFARLGGAVYAFQSRLRIERTDLIDNTAQMGGGGFYSSGSVGVLRHCALLGNTMVSHSTFGGGGAQVRDSFLGPVSVIDFENCTFAANSAVRGGAIQNEGDSTTRLRNTILWANTANTGPELNITGGSVTNFYSLIAGSGGSADWQSGFGVDGGGNLDTDPLFANVDARDVHLQSCTGRWMPDGWVKDAVFSPCIDAGDPVMTIGGEPFPHGGIINMGRYGGTFEASKSRYRGTLMLVK